MLIKLLEGQWVNTDLIESITEQKEANTQVFKQTYVNFPGESNFYITKERADDLAKRINSPEDVLEELEVTRLGQKPLQLVNDGYYAIEASSEGGAVVEVYMFYLCIDRDKWIAEKPQIRKGVGLDDSDVVRAKKNRQVRTLNNKDICTIDGYFNP